MRTLIESKATSKDIAIAEGHVSWHEYFLKILKQEFERQREKNPQYSLRQWAKKLNISSGAASEILAGRRQVSESKALVILDHLKIEGLQKQRILAAMKRPFVYDRFKPSKEDAWLVVDWINQAICGYYELTEHNVDAQYISEQIKIPVAEIETRTEMLLSKGILQVDAAGKMIHRPDELWDITQVFSKEEHQKIQTQSIQLAEAAVTAVESPDKTFISCTFSGSTEQLLYLKKEIANLVNSMALASATEARSELIRFSVQVYPMRFQKSVRKNSP